MKCLEGARVLPIIALVCAWPAVAGGQPIAYVSAGDQIVAVNATGPATAVHTSSCGVLSGDLALAADGWLYFAEPGCSRVSRVDPSVRSNRNGANPSYQVLFTSPSAPTEIRIGADFSVYFNTQANGVWKLDPGTFAASPVAGTGGLGLAFAHNGDLLFTSGGQVQRSPSAPSFTPFSAAGAVGLGVSNGGRGTAVKTTAGEPRLPTGTICYAAANTLRCADRTGANDTPYATLPAGQLVRYFEFLSDDTAIVAASVNPTEGTKAPNGFLYRVDGSGVQQIYATPKVKGSYQPINGTAIGASNQSISDAAPIAGERLYDFGDFEVEIITLEACALTVVAEQLSVATVQSWFDHLNSHTTNGYSPAPLLGEGSYRTGVHVTVDSGLCGSPVTVYMQGFFDDPFGQSFAMTHFTLDGDDVVASEVITFGYYPFAAPDDGGVRGKSDSFSHFLPAVVEQAAFPATFCGFEDPVNDEARVPPLSGAEAFATKAKMGSSIPLKFKLSTDGCATTFVVDFPNYPETGAIVAVMRLSDGAHYDIHPPGQSFEPPVFSIGADGVTHQFNLDTTPRPDAPWQPGLHVITVQSLDGLFPPASVLVNIVN